MEKLIIILKLSQGPSMKYVTTKIDESWPPPSPLSHTSHKPHRLPPPRILSHFKQARKLTSRKTSSILPPPRICKLYRLPPSSNFYPPPRISLTTQESESRKSRILPPPSNLQTLSNYPPSIKVKKGSEKLEGPPVAPPTKNSWLRSLRGYVW